MISLRRVVLSLLLIVLLLSFCGKDETTPFTVKGTVYLDDQPRGLVDVEFGVKSAGQYAEDPWTETVKRTGSDGTFTFTTTDNGYLCRLRVKHPSTNEWEKAYIDYEDSDKKSGSNKTWTYDFYLTTPAQ